MSQCTIMVTYVYRRKLPSPVKAEEYVYQLWIVTEIRPAGPDEADPGPVLQTIYADDSKRLGERLKDASAKSAANSIEGAIWKVWQTSDNLTLDQALNFINSVSDSLHGAVQGSLESLADATSVPVPLNLAGTEVIATLLTEPIEEPIEHIKHGLELTGIFLGLLTGLYPLVMTCAKYLIHDEINGKLAEALKSALDTAFRGLARAFGVEAHSVEEAAADVQAAESMSAVQRARRLEAAHNRLGISFTSPASDGTCAENPAVSQAVESTSEAAQNGTLVTPRAPADARGNTAVSQAATGPTAVGR